MWCLGAIRLQAIAWANVVLYICRYVAPLDHNELVNLYIVSEHVASVQDI